MGIDAKERTAHHLLAQMMGSPFINPLNLLILNSLILMILGLLFGTMEKLK